MSDWLQETMQGAMESARFEVKAGHECRPFFIFDTPENLYIVTVPLPDDLNERIERFGLIQKFMIAKEVKRFVFGGELKVPDAIHACGVSQDEVRQVMQVIRRQPLGFENEDWHKTTEAGLQMRTMLPRPGVQLLPVDSELVEKVFGENGLFPPRPWERVVH